MFICCQFALRELAATLRITNLVQPATTELRDVLVSFLKTVKIAEPEGVHKRHYS